MPRPFRLRSPKIKVSENDVESGCVDLLRYRGYFVARLHSGLFKTADGRWIRIGEKGLPDWAAIHPDRPGFLLETKRPGAGLSADQAEKIRGIRLGYRLAVAVVDSVDELIEWLAGHEAK